MYPKALFPLFFDMLGFIFGRLREFYSLIQRYLVFELFLVSLLVMISAAGYYSVAILLELQYQRCARPGAIRVTYGCGVEIGRTVLSRHICSRVGFVMLMAAKRQCYRHTGEQLFYLSLWMQTEYVFVGSPNCIGRQLMRANNDNLVFMPMDILFEPAIAPIGHVPRYRFSFIR